MVVHGDDFTAWGAPDMLDKYEAALQANFDVKLRGRLGEHDTDLKQTNVLNRNLHIHDNGLAYEADPRHVELRSRSLGLKNSKRMTTPCAKYNNTTTTVPDDEDTLDEQADGVVQVVTSKNQPRLKRVNRHGVADTVMHHGLFQWQHLLR